MFIEGRQSYNKFCIKVDKEMKIKDLLIDELKFSTRSVSKIKRDKLITVNGEFRKPSLNVEKGDVIEIIFDEDKSNFTPQNLGVKKIYEDFDLIIVDKPPFMVVHPTKSHFENTLANHMMYNIESSKEKYKIRFVNRLDMDTSGLVVVAKSAYSHHIMSQDMADDNIKKEYIAVVDGVMKQEKGTIDAPIYRGSMDSIIRVVDERGQRSITHYEVLERLDNATVVKLVLETGRTHQIRVHLSHIGHGIIGDKLYGIDDDNLINRQALNAYRLTFRQPRMRNEITVKNELPNDMVELIKKLGGRYDY